MTRRSTVVAGTAAFAVVWLAAVWWGVREIPRDLLERTRAAFDEVSLDRSVVSFEGRRAILQGEVRQASDVARAEEVARRVRGVASVVNRLTVVRVETPAATEIAPKGWVELRFTGGGALVRGIVPRAEDEVRLLGAARELAGGNGVVHDAVEVDLSIGPAPYPAQAVVVAKVLARTTKGAVRVDAGTVRLEGSVASEGDRQTLLRLVRAAAPGLSVNDQLTVASDDADRREREPQRLPEGADPDGSGPRGPGELRRAVAAILAEQRIEFVPGAATFTASSQPTLSRLAALLVDAGRARIAVAAHTADSGNAAADRELSTRRARAVADFLVSRGVSSERVVAEGYGALMPAGDGEVSERVEIHVMGED